MPPPSSCAEQIRPELPAKIDWPRLLQLKAKWQVSLGALLRRAITLGVMSETTYTSAMRTMSTRADGAPVSPVISAHLSHRQRSWGRRPWQALSSMELSRETGWPRELIDDVLSASGDQRPELDL